MLLTLAGWTSPTPWRRRLAYEWTRWRLWRMKFMAGGVEALKVRVPPGPAPVKVLRALEVAEEALSMPRAADRPNWTLPRFADEVERRSGVRISRSRLSVVLRKKGIFAGGVHTLKGRQDADAVKPLVCVGLLKKPQAEAGEIVLLFGDEFEGAHASLSRPCLGQEGSRCAHPAPGHGRLRDAPRVLDWKERELVACTSRTKRSTDFVALLEDSDRRYGPKPGGAIKPTVLTLDNGPIHTSSDTRRARRAGRCRDDRVAAKYVPNSTTSRRDRRDLSGTISLIRPSPEPMTSTVVFHAAIAKLNGQRMRHLVSRRPGDVGESVMQKIRTLR